MRTATSTGLRRTRKCTASSTTSNGPLALTSTDAGCTRRWSSGRPRPRSPTSDPFLRSDDAEAEPPHQPEAGFVLGEDTSLKRPESRPLRAVDHGSEQGRADAFTARLLADV